MIGFIVLQSGIISEGSGINDLATVTGFEEKGVIEAVLWYPAPRTRLWRDRQREIIPIAAFVAGLEVVPVHVYDRAVGQVAEGAGDLGRGGVVDDHEDCAQTNSSRANLQSYSRVRRDNHTVSRDLISRSRLRVQLNDQVPSVAKQDLTLNKELADGPAHCSR
jgi:hypothetical protein